MVLRKSTRNYASPSIEYLNIQIEGSVLIMSDLTGGKSEGYDFEDFDFGNNDREGIGALGL